jgi:hypothetical protein
MRYEITAAESRLEKSTSVAGEVGTVAAFCLVGFMVSIFVAAHMPMSSLLLGG